MMLAVNSALRKLEALSSSDRRWILERLPDDLKARLIRSDSAYPPDIPEKDEEGHAGRVNQNASLDDIHPGIAAELLKREPRWIVEALMQCGSFAWQKNVFRLLPMHVRLKESMSGRQAPQISEPVLDSLVHALREKAREVRFIPDEYPVSRWKSWLARLMSRRLAT